MIFAQDIPSEGLSSGWYSPVILAGIVYVALFVAGRVLDGRGDARASAVADAAFALVLLTGAYMVVLAVVAVVSEIELVSDLVLVVLVVVVFFAILLLLLLALFERGIGGISRMRRRARG